jgi:glycosyltransferase involved in cell wall biosynthesis
MNKTPLSVIIPAYNEENMIEDCLKSVAWANEIILVDNGSEDATASIAKRYGARVINCPRGEIDYSKPRNLGAKAATNEWLFYHERTTPAVKAEIEKAMLDSRYSGYSFPRKNILLGHPMRFGGWWPDRVLRLIKKADLKKWQGKLHEQPEIDGKIRNLKSPLTHITHRDLSSMIAKTNSWSNLEAELLYKAHHPKMAWWRFVSVAFREFWYRGIIKLGFLDGTVGVIEIIYQMFSRMITYSKLWEMQKEKK